MPHNNLEDAKKRYRSNSEREQHRIRCSQENLRLRLLVLEHLGGAVCRTCGYCKDYRALQIDHINGDGAVERKTVPTGVARYRKLLLDPDVKLRLQVLCANCNQLKRFDNNEHRKRNTGGDPINPGVTPPYQNSICELKGNL